MTTLGGKLRIKSIMLKTYDTPDSAKLLKTSSQLTSRNFPENLINFFFIAINLNHGIKYIFLFQDDDIGSKNVTCLS